MQDRVHPPRDFEGVIVALDQLLQYPNPPVELKDIIRQFEELASYLPKAESHALLKVLEKKTEKKGMLKDFISWLSSPKKPIRQTSPGGQRFIAEQLQQEILPRLMNQEEKSLPTDANIVFYQRIFKLQIALAYVAPLNDPVYSASPHVLSFKDPISLQIFNLNNPHLIAMSDGKLYLKSSLQEFFKTAKYDLKKEQFMHPNGMTFISKHEETYLQGHGFSLERTPALISRAFVEATGLDVTGMPYVNSITSSKQAKGYQIGYYIGLGLFGLLYLASPLLFVYTPFALSFLPITAPIISVAYGVFDILSDNENAFKNMAKTAVGFYVIAVLASLLLTGLTATSLVPTAIILSTLAAHHTIMTLYPLSLLAMSFVCQRFRGSFHDPIDKLFSMMNKVVKKLSAGIFGGIALGCVKLHEGIKEWISKRCARRRTSIPVIIVANSEAKGVMTSQSVLASLNEAEEDHKHVSPPASPTSSLSSTASISSDYVSGGLIPTPSITFLAQSVFHHPASVSVPVDVDDVPVQPKKSFCSMM